MSDLFPIPFPALLRRMQKEVEVSDSIFDLPTRKWYRPDPTLDLSAVHFSRKASTPLGPAAGPHTQLAQNIVLAWLAGGRILELKTVQVNDNLKIPRPCIHAPNVAFNVEWSQELRVQESLKEYAKAAYLIEVLKSTRGFGVFESEVGFDTIFDISVGYDLDGIRSEKVLGFIRGLQNPEPLFEALRGELPGDLKEFRELEMPAVISDCVTLSTFHGCPADQIESIARFLAEELGLRVILKLNPTLLGFEEVEHLLYERLGFTHLRLVPEAFEEDLRYDDALAILGSLREVGGSVQRTIGAKFTNTLVVANDPGFFPTQPDPYMYLSGAPLHLISMTLMQRFREDLGFEFPVSFSAGIDSKNFPAAVACGMVPVTTCTDLLKPGGFGRLPAYLRALGREMASRGVTSREAYVLSARGNGATAVEEALSSLPGGAEIWAEEGHCLVTSGLESPDDLPRLIRELAAAHGLDGEELLLTATRVAGRLNGREIVPALSEDPRYHASQTARSPRKVDRVLGLYDCINCDLCVSACPNDAIFVYSPTPVSVGTEEIVLEGDGSVGRSPGRGFQLQADHQLGVFEGGCNECSNCEVYCPETGAPFREKERVFATEERFARSVDDGFFHRGNLLLARIEGRSYRLVTTSDQTRVHLSASGLEMEVDWERLSVPEEWIVECDPPIDTAVLWRMKTVWDTVYHGMRPNPVNPPLP